jgi:hypothetical protein
MRRRGEDIFMIWCRFQKDNAISYGIVEGDYVTAVDGDPFTAHRPTANAFRLGEVKLLVPVLPPTFYAIGSNYRTHVIERSKAKGFKEPKFYDRPRVGYRANSALIATGENIVKPADSGPRFEYEGELVAVIGKRCRNVSPEEANAYIFGWTIFLLLPGLAGFLVWELKENWRLYAANRPPSRRTMLRLTSAASVSRSASQTDSAASSVKRPAKTASRANNFRSSGFNRSCPHARVLRRVC